MFTIIQCQKGMAFGYYPSDLIAWGARRAIVRRAYAYRVMEVIADMLDGEDKKVIDWTKILKYAEKDFDVLYG